MSHVDEGALHAYLDGALEEYPAGEARRIRAHLERCERCAEALREARRIRDRAESVLAVPELAVTPPPLEELKRIARSGATETRASRRWGRRQRLGWAASVVLALGIGWIVRGGMPLPTAGPDRTTPTAETARAGDADRVSTVAPSAGLADAGASPAAGERSENAVEASEPAGTRDAEALERSVPSEDRSVMAEAQVADASPAEVTAPEPVAPLELQEVDVTSVDTDRAARIDDELDVPIAIVGTSFTPTAPSPSAEVAGDSAEAAGDTAPTASTLPADTASTTGAEGRAADERAAEEREAAPRSEAARLSLASRSAAAGTALGRGVERAPAEDEARVDGAAEPGSLVVPGLEVLSIVWREEGVVPAGVRVIQRLDEGQELELIHLPSGFDPSAVDPAESGVNELVVPRGQGWLILRAPVEVPQLRLLLERMDAPPER